MDLLLMAMEVKGYYPVLKIEAQRATAALWHSPLSLSKVQKRKMSGYQ